MRNQGYYHVRRGIKWDIAYYTPHFGGAWVFAGSNEEWDDLNLEEIDERRITREEPLAAKISGTTERIAQNE